MSPQQNNQGGNMAGGVVFGLAILGVLIFLIVETFSQYPGFCLIALALIIFGGAIAGVGGGGVGGVICLVGLIFLIFATVTVFNNDADKGKQMVWDQEKQTYVNSPEDQKADKERGFWSTPWR